VLYDQNYQLNGSPTLNPDFLKVNPWTTGVAGLGYGGYQRPFYARFSVRYTF